MIVYKMYVFPNMLYHYMFLLESYSKDVFFKIHFVSFDKSTAVCSRFTSYSIFFNAFGDLWLYL